MTETWICLDCETTGLEPGSRLIELAAVACDESGRATRRFSALVCPGMPLPEDSAAVTGLSDAELIDADTAPAVLRRFLDWLPDDGLLVAHNARFDVNVLGWEMQRAELSAPRLRVVDSVKLARALDETPDCRLQTIIATHRWQLHGPAHRAEPDADAVRLLLTRARERLPRTRFGQLCTGTRFRSAWQHEAELPETLHTLPEHVALGRPFAFHYTTADGWSSSRSITPFGFARTGKGLRFHGFCHYCSARRSFAAERVAVARPA